MQRHLTVASLFVLAASPLAHADLSPDQKRITSQAMSVRSVFAADVDGDGDPDVLSASASDDTVAWHENLGGGVFGARHVITTAADKAVCVHAADLDGDGDVDVLSTSFGDDEVAWYENLGAGVFGPQQMLDTTSQDPRSVFAADLDGDGDPDVLSASSTSVGVAWYENLGGGSFGARQVIDATLDQAYCVRAADLDGDGDADVLAAGLYPGVLAWYENLGAGLLGPKQVIGTASGYGSYTFTVDDLDADGDPDILWLPQHSGSGSDRHVRWYANDGTGQFQSYLVYGYSAYSPFCVTAADLDGDGARDVVWGEGGSVLASHENVGGGATLQFDDEQVISSTVSAYPFDLCAADLDGDGDVDLVVAAILDNAVVWFENQTIDPTTIVGMCFGDGFDGTPCPCSNDTTPGAQEGCRNSQGHGAVLDVESGGPDFALDDLVLRVSQARPGQPAVLIQGSSQIALPFKDGKLCMGFPTERTEFLQLDASGRAVTTQSIVTGGNVPGPGATRYYQAWYRDPAISVCGSGSNLTSGLVVDWI